MDTDDILPLLEPADWNLRAQMVCRPLSVIDAPEMPFVTYGWDRPHTFEMLGAEQAGGATADSLDAIAIAHLRKRSATWERMEIKLGWFKKMRFLVCGDDFLAAERILDGEFMAQAQDRLGAAMLAVGIPRRGMLMAIDGAQKPELLVRFCAAVAGQYHRGETPPITPTVFGMLEGRIVGHLADSGVAREVKHRVAAEV